MQSILDQVGPVLPHHFALRIRQGRMITAVAIFTEFFGGWTEIKERRSDLAWGSIRWLKSVYNPAVLIQLTEIYSDKGEWNEEMHLALAARDPWLAGNRLVELIENNLTDGPPCKISELPGGKYWVEIPAIFGSPIEFVPIE